MNNIEKLMKNIPEGSDCVLIISDINRRYFTGMKSSEGVFICFKNSAYLLIDFRYIEKAKKIVKDCQVILLDDIYPQIKEIMKKHNAHIISVESKEMTINNLNSYRKNLSGLSFDTSDKLSDLIYNMRTVKSNDEIEKIKSAQKIADNAFSYILDFVKVGKTEKEIALELDYFMLKNGAEAVSFDTIALAGKNTSMPHGVPSDYKVQQGDFVLMDFGAVYEGCHSDMTRTVCAGSYTDEMENIYNIVLSAQKKALETVKAGIKGNQLDKSARDIIQKAGYGKEFGHSLGHGVGMEIHEFPRASQKSSEILSVNSVVTIEPGIYIPDKFGVRIEDMVKISENGYMNFTQSPKNLICL